MAEMESSIPSGLENRRAPALVSAILASVVSMLSGSESKAFGCNPKVPGAIPGGSFYACVVLTGTARGLYPRDVRAIRATGFGHSPAVEKPL